MEPFIVVLFSIMLAPALVTAWWRTLGLGPRWVSYFVSSLLFPFDFRFGFLSLSLVFSFLFVLLCVGCFSFSVFVGCWLFLFGLLVLFVLSPCAVFFLLSHPLGVIVCPSHRQDISQDLGSPFRYELTVIGLSLFSGVFIVSFSIFWFVSILHVLLFFLIILCLGRSHPFGRIGGLAS